MLRFFCRGLGGFIVRVEFWRFVDFLVVEGGKVLRRNIVIGVKIGVNFVSGFVYRMLFFRLGEVRVWFRCY